MIGLLLIDDHPVVREGLVAMLSTQPDMQILAEAGNGNQALSLIKQHRPGVILLDLHLGDMNGSEVIEQTLAFWPEARFLVLTAYDTDEDVLQAVRAGAQGYLLKGVPKEELFQAVRAINQGSSLFGPGITSRLLQAAGSVDSASERVDPLTQREMEILRMISDGSRNKEIASAMSLSERTVKFYVNSIFQKLGASSRTEAVKLASQQGLIRL